MFANPLDEHEVVYFIFPHMDCYGFWNKNVDFPLSLAFLDDDHRIVDFKDLEKQCDKSVYPKASNVKYVVEANKGIFDKLNINKGDKLINKGTKLILKRDFNI